MMEPVNNYTNDLGNDPAPVKPSDETASLTDSSAILQFHERPETEAPSYIAPGSLNYRN